MTSKAIHAMIDAARSPPAAAQPDESDHVPGLSISDEDAMDIVALCHEAEDLRRTQEVEP